MGPLQQPEKGKRKKNKENKEHCNDNLEKAAARS